MGQSLEVFQDSFYLFNIFGYKNLKINVFCEKNIFGCIFIKSNCMCLWTSPGDWKNTKHLKFDIRLIFTHFLKKKEKITFSENFENRL